MFVGWCRALCDILFEYLPLPTGGAVALPTRRNPTKDWFSLYFDAALLGCEEDAAFCHVSNHHVTVALHAVHGIPSSGDCVFCVD